jgi:hypothetical protein
MRVISIAIMVAAMTGTPAVAQGNASLDAVTACRSIADNAARLQCFDRAAAALDDAKRNDGLVVLNRTEVREKKRTLFGLKLPDINLFGGGKDEEQRTQISEIDSVVKGLQPSGRDRWTVRFEDGSIWRTTEPAKFPPKLGDKVKVKRAALGSFRASFNGDYAVRIERVE